MNGTTFQLQQYATLDATLGDPNQGMSKIFLSGSMYASPVDQSGHFAVNRVAPGNYTLVGLVASELVTCGSVSLVSGQSATVTGLNSSIDRVLIDDFNSGISTSALGMIQPGLYWYSYSDSGSARWNPEAARWDWTAFPSPTSSGRSMARMRPESDPAGNTFIRCEVAFDNSAGDSGVGIHLKDVNGYGMDLSKMTSLSLRCRGDGSLIVSLETNALETATNSGSNYAYVIALTDSWVQHRIYPDSLKIWPAISNPGQFKWSEVSKRVEQIEFFYTSSGLPLYDTLNMMLDDLYLDGVRLSDVAP